jgi:hypothetical protein
LLTCAAVVSSFVFTLPVFPVAVVVGGGSVALNPANLAVNAVLATFFIMADELVLIELDDNLQSQ